MTDTKSPTIEVQQQYAYFLLPYEVEVTVDASANTALTKYSSIKNYRGNR